MVARHVPVVTGEHYRQWVFNGEDLLERSKRGKRQVKADVRAGQGVLVDFDGQHIGAGLQVDGDRVFVPIALGISKSKFCRKGIERDVAVGHIATEHLFTIKINDGPVVATQLEEADGRRGLAFADVEGVPEISRRVLIVRIAAVRDNGHFIAVAIAQFGTALCPCRVLIVRHAPGRPEVYTRIVVFPARPFLDPLHGGHLGPTDKFMAGLGLCGQGKGHVWEVWTGPRGAGDEEVVQPHPTRLKGQVTGMELHGRVEIEFRGEVIEHERRAFTCKGA